MHFEGFGHTQTKRQAAKKDFPHALEMTKEEGARKGRRKDKKKNRFAMQAAKS
ncbi:hypothetical protein [Thermonema rossianum]|jgi:hypothetical protein|uniref:hypothetical protein n=1 Tax=Thermonema rossianum TaxID=55505 RepID=UPI0012F9E6CE|nr:hypothetical protein [Thermonema rossianum]